MGRAPMALVPDDVQVDAVEVLALADYGSAPSGWIDAAPYAFRVFQRRRALKEQLAVQRRLHLEAERASEQTLARLAETVKSRVGPEHRAHGLLAGLGSVDEVAQTRDGALRSASQQYSADVARIDAQLGQHEAEREKLEAAVAEAQAEANRRHELRARGDAKMKRVEIELRAALEAARVAAGPNAKFAPPEHAARIKDLKSERDVRAGELRPLVAASDEAVESVRKRESAARDGRRAVSSLREERRKIEQAATRQLEIRSAGVEEAERERLKSYASVARELLLTCADDIPAEDRAAVDDAERLLGERALSVEKHLRALGAADVEGERRGWIVIAVAASLLLLLLAMTVRTAAH